MILMTIWIVKIIWKIVATEYSNTEWMAKWCIIIVVVHFWGYMRKTLHYGNHTIYRLCQVSYEWIN